MHSELHGAGSSTSGSEAASHVTILKEPTGILSWMRRMCVFGGCGLKGGSLSWDVCGGGCPRLCIPVDPCLTSKHTSNTQDLSQMLSAAPASLPVHPNLLDQKAWWSHFLCTIPWLLAPLCPCKSSVIQPAKLQCGNETEGI